MKTNKLIGMALVYEAIATAAQQKILEDIELGTKQKNNPIIPKSIHKIYKTKTKSAKQIIARSKAKQTRKSKRK